MAMVVTKCLLVAAVLYAICETSTGLNVAAFNVRGFGTSKARNAIVRNIIAKVIMRYDVTFIQEIRGNATYVCTALEEEISNLGGSYGYVHSDKLGRNSYTETYAYFYKKRTVEIVEVYQYDDGPDDGTDAFQREPFAVHIHPKCEREQKTIFENFTTGMTGSVTEPVIPVVKFSKIVYSWPVNGHLSRPLRKPVLAGDLTNFTIIGIHVKPDMVRQELRDLHTASQTIVAHFNNNPNVLLLGDLNAGCTYISLQELLSLALGARQYQWLITYYDDTTVGPTSCSYDRIIVSGNALQAAVLTSPSNVFHFDTTYSLRIDQALAVSDHYPVYVELAIATK